MIKINICWGDLTDVTAKTATLVCRRQMAGRMSVAAAIAYILATLCVTQTTPGGPFSAVPKFQQKELKLKREVDAPSCGTTVLFSKSNGTFMRYFNPYMYF